jgi:hypothetical protein
MAVWQSVQELHSDHACWALPQISSGHCPSQVVDGKSLLVRTDVSNAVSFISPTIAKVALPAFTPESRHRWATWFPRALLTQPLARQVLSVVWCGKRPGSVSYKCDAFATPGDKKWPVLAIFLPEYEAAIRSGTQHSGVGHIRANAVPESCRCAYSGTIIFARILHASVLPEY